MQGLEEKPGEADARNFVKHWSVDFWKNRGFTQELPGSKSNGTVSK